MCRRSVKQMKIEVEHDPMLDDIWSHITDTLRDMVQQGEIRLRERIRIGSVITFRDEHDAVLRILDLS